MYHLFFFVISTNSFHGRLFPKFSIRSSSVLGMLNGKEPRILVGSWIIAGSKCLITNCSATLSSSLRVFSLSVNGSIKPSDHSWNPVE